MLGTAFREVLMTDYPGTKVIALPRGALDVTDRSAVLGLSNCKPDFILHCAADVNADRCEADPATCRRIQVGGTRNILDLASLADARILYPQSFLIFQGGAGLIDERTQPSPMSVYGHCKLEAEDLVRQSSAESLVVRMGGFFGGYQLDKNFVGKFTRHLAGLINDGVTDYAVGDRIWQPTYTMDLARNCLLLLEHQRNGVWSMACEGEASFFEVAAACVNSLGLSDRFTVVPATKDVIASGDVATRPDRAVMSNASLQEAGLCMQRPWRDALDEYLGGAWFSSLFHRIKR
jgi:dTDP-4-dehydrorhamnose reductase